MPTPDEIKRVLEFPLPVERVWQAVATPEGLANWFSDRAEAQAEAEPGGEVYHLTWEGQGTFRAEIKTRQPPRRFAFRWGAHGYQAGTPYTPENSTLVTFTLEGTPSGTRLTVSETGFAGLAPEHRQASFEDNTDGWTHELGELQAYLATLEAA